MRSMFSRCRSILTLAVATTLAAAVPDSQVCLSAAKARLGPRAVVVTCGQLGNPAATELLAAVKPSRATATGYCVPVSQFVVLRAENSGWTAVLERGREIRNSEGYIALDYIDDIADFAGYCLEILKTRSDGKPTFTIVLSYFNDRGDIEGSQTEISWDGNVRRYREFDAEGFRPEIKNPPHIQAKKRAK